MMLDSFDLLQLVEPLERWFAGHARRLPWREEPTAYHVWISEIMLQQTRVEAVKPYYERFITKLPDVRALAECPEDEYLKLWEGLGYYSRVRNLSAAAKQVMTEYGGRIPQEYESLLALKGIGHYTAGAIASIAYNEPVPAVDGNVLRVLARVAADDSDIMKQSVRTMVEKKLTELMRTCCGSTESAPGRQAVLHPGIFNQALMELGAIVCLPNGIPRCEECPWNLMCEARRQNRVDELPVRMKAKGRRMEEKTVFVIRDGDRVAIHKRAPRGLLAGLYELPNREGHLSSEEALAYMKSLGYRPVRIQPLADAKHVFSHVEWHMKGYVVLVEDTESESTAADYLFVEAQDAKERYAIPSAFSRYAAYMNIPVGKEAIGS